MDTTNLIDSKSSLYLHQSVDERVTSGAQWRDARIVSPPCRAFPPSPIPNPVSVQSSFLFLSPFLSLGPFLSHSAQSLALSFDREARDQRDAGRRGGGGGRSVRRSSGAAYHEFAR